MRKTNRRSLLGELFAPAIERVGVIDWSECMSCEIGFAVQSGTGSVGFNGTQASVQVIEVSPIALLAGVSPSESREIISIARPSSYAKGENLFLERQAANSLILIETGRVKLSRVGRDGGEVILRICGPGEIVDVYDESGNGRHSYSAQAMGDCRVLIWDSKQAFALGAHYPQIRINLLRILANRLDELEERYCEFATDNCGQRLARTLLRCVDSAGRTNYGGARVALSRRELAQMVGSTVFTISRTLSKWAEHGIVSRGRNAVVVHRPSELRTLIEHNI